MQIIHYSSPLWRGEEYSAPRAMLIIFGYLIIFAFAVPAVLFFLLLFFVAFFRWINCVGVALNRDASVRGDYATEMFERKLYASVTVIVFCFFLGFFYLLFNYYRCYSCFIPRADYPSVVVCVHALGLGQTSFRIAILSFPFRHLNGIHAGSSFPCLFFPLLSFFPELGGWLLVHESSSPLHKQPPAGLERAWKRLGEASICQAG